jgi:hypothetical protein
MSVSYGLTEYDADDFRDVIAGDFPIEQYPKATIATAGKELKRGTPLGKKTADSKYYEWDSEAEDGTENLDGILADDVDVTSENVVAPIFITGEFNATQIYTVSSIEVPEGVYNNTGLIIIREEVI